MLGTKGLDVNDPAQKYSLRSLPGQFSGLHLVSIMDVGMKTHRPVRGHRLRPLAGVRGGEEALPGVRDRSVVTLAELTARANAFRDARDWRQFRTQRTSCCRSPSRPRNSSSTPSGEATTLLRAHLAEEHKPSARSSRHPLLDAGHCGRPRHRPRGCVPSQDGEEPARYPVEKAPGAPRSTTSSENARQNFHGGPGGSAKRQRQWAPAATSQ